MQIEQVVSNDVGDQTANRFRYQWICAAVCCCQMLSPDSKVTEVFCEHHEDILIKTSSDKYIGVQIKTKAHDQPLWTSNDETVINSFSRFVMLDQNFPDQFIRFVFATNHPTQATSNGKDIVYLLNKIKEDCAYTDQPRVVTSFVKKVSEKAKVLPEITYVSLKKCGVQQDLPHLKDISMRLINNLAIDWETAKTGSLPAVKQAAEVLVSECAKASALAEQDYLPFYIGVSNEEETRGLIESKTFNRTRVLGILNSAFNGDLPLFRAFDFEEETSYDKNLLREKMTAGGFSATSTLYAEDLRDTADYAGYQLIQKYGADLGKQRYDELKLKVHKEAAIAFESEKEHMDPFGVKMLEKMREQLKTRVASGENLYGFTSDHLEGLAYALTSQCKVAWSIKRPWEEK